MLRHGGLGRVHPFVIDPSALSQLSPTLAAEASKPALVSHPLYLAGHIGYYDTPARRDAQVLVHEDPGVQGLAA